MITIDKIYEYLNCKKAFNGCNSFRIIKIIDIEFNILITYERMVNERLLSNVYFITRRSYNNWLISQRKEKIKILNNL